MAGTDSASRCHSCTDWLVSAMTLFSLFSYTRLVSIDGIMATADIFIVQRWIYRIDPDRVNEYGQVLNADVLKIDESGESKKKK
jgi:hypothetical protein